MKHSLQEAANKYAKQFTCIPVDETEAAVNQEIIEAISKHFLAGAKWALELAAKTAAGPDEGYLHGCDCRMRIKNLSETE